MLGLYVTSGGRVVRHVSVADLNRHRIAVLRGQRRRRAAERQQRRWDRLAVRLHWLDERADRSRRKQAARRATISRKHLERQRCHRAMLLRRDRIRGRTRRPPQPSGG